MLKVIAIVGLQTTRRCVEVILVLSQNGKYSVCSVTVWGRFAIGTVDAGIDFMA